MVLYYTSNVVTPPATIYMGKDKFESKYGSHHLFHLYFKTHWKFSLDEDLIKYGFPEDVWYVS